MDKLQKKKPCRTEKKGIVRWNGCHLQPTVPNGCHLLFYRRKSITTAKLRTFQSKLASNTQTALAGKIVLAANKTEKTCTAHANHISNTQNHQTGNQDIMIKQRKRNTTFLLKLMPIAPNNSKWMPLAISRKRKSIITANKEHSSLLSSNTQTTLM